MLIRTCPDISSNPNSKSPLTRGWALKVIIGLAISLSIPQRIFAADSQVIEKSSEAKPSETKPSGNKKKNIPIISPEPKKEIKVQNQSQSNSGKSGQAFEELNFSKTLIIEGKVEKPQVQFTLLKEAPPEKEIRFETSFMQNILQMKRENTFKVQD